MDSKTFGSRVYGGDHGSRDTDMLDFFPFSHAKNVSQRKMKTERNPMKSKILSAAPLLVGCFIASGIVVASLDAGSGRIRSDISPSSEHTTPVTVTSHTRTVRHESELCQESRAPW